MGLLDLFHNQGKGQPIGDAGGILPFSDDFNRANGAIGNPWLGATYTISSNKAINTPVTFGAEDITNGNMESGDPPDSWVADAATLASEADERTGGAGSASISVTNDGAAKGYAEQALDLPDGTWIYLDLYAKRITGNIGWNISQSDDTVILSSGSTSASWVQKFMTTRLVGAGCKVRVYTNTTNPGDESRFDDVSVKAMTLSELFSSLSVSTQDVVADVDVVRAAGHMAGLVLCLDDVATPANFLIAYHDGTRVYLVKCVAGTYTTLIASAGGYSSGATLRVIKSGVSVELWYDGNKVGATQTVNDAGVKDNKIHGLFSTYSANTLDNYSLVKN